MQRMRFRFLVLTFLVLALAVATDGRAATPYDADGPYAVTTTDVVWTDAARQRALPLRIRLPDAPGARPVVIFSHGLGGSVDGGRAWGERWASQGFIVIHLQHPGSDESVWRGAERPLQSLRAAVSLDQYLARVADVKFVLDELERRRQQGDALALRADLARVGMSGHSFGAQTTQALAGQRFDVPAAMRPLAAGLIDPRLRAFIAFSPSARSPQAASQFATIARPFMSVTGTADGQVGAGLGVDPPLRRVPFEGMPGPDQYLVVLAGADHMVFNGAPLRRGSRDEARDAEQTAIVAAVTTAFWRAYLADDMAARDWLAADAEGAVGATGEFKRK
jgi:predicted dienelactone hydrolase